MRLLIWLFVTSILVELSFWGIAKCFPRPNPLTYLFSNLAGDVDCDAGGRRSLSGGHIASYRNNHHCFRVRAAYIRFCAARGQNIAQAKLN
jgi:hypothetical protein